MKSFNMYSARLALLLFCSFAIISNLSIVSCSVLITILGLSDGIIKNPLSMLTRCIHLWYILRVQRVYTLYTLIAGYANLLFKSPLTN